jgi:hypothetical protein
MHDAISAAETAVLLAGPKLGDAAALKLVIQELVALGSAHCVMVSEPRRIGPVRRTLVLTPGDRQRLTGNKVLDAVLLVLHGHEPRGGRDEVRADALASPGILAEVRAMFTAAVTYGEMPRPRSFADGTVGMTVVDLASALFRRHRRAGFVLARSHGFVRQIVLPALVERGCLDQTHKRTSLGQSLRDAARQRLGIRFGRAAPKALAAELRAPIQGPAAAAAFDAIDRAVEQAWIELYRD